MGRDAGELAGLGVNGILVTGDIEPLLAEADGVLDFTVPAATVALRRQARAARPAPRHRHHRLSAGPGEGDRGRRPVRGS